ncbi:HAMP domain-containing histidine kinase [Tissierella sp. MSJ-40]|uniref:histidine kinase n=1 Tax=Tissierella simiarum TaxID=2841534 RepID=A0ABS6EAB1_9FIRM|nr:HAMP domain-containing sensor histidine kinase [Tissierella simiarum]MBU5439699.1 HAMP domain-containing histidine kinase [Tissierella simiarum]
MLRNQEFRSIILKLVIFQLVFGITGFLIVNESMNKLNKNIVEQNIALVGNLLKNHPELEEEIAPYLTKEIPKTNITIGQETLQKYGYNINMEKNLQPVLKNISPNLQIYMFFIILLFIIPLVFIVKEEYKKVYGKVQEIYSAAEKVVEGDFTIYLREEGEGDFNILNHQFNQMSNRLKNNLEILQKEKTFLKNTMSDISHQLKTPLSSLIMLNDLMLEEENMDLKVRLNFLEKTKIQLDRMEWLIINLLKVARIEAGAIEFKRERILLKGPVDIALSTLSYNLKEKGQSVEIIGDLNGVFYGDKDWTGEALINIIKNSIEHGREAGTIQIELEETPLFSSIIVKDNGEGIEEKDLPHIFKRFYKGKSEVKPESIGIGLNLAKLIVESQEGTISVKSKKGQGTKFTITFLKGII